jgi:hypothetical protein
MGPRHVFTWCVRHSDGCICSLCNVIDLNCSNFGGGVDIALGTVGRTCVFNWWWMGKTLRFDRLYIKKAPSTFGKCKTHVYPIVHSTRTLKSRLLTLDSKVPKSMSQFIAIINPSIEIDIKLISMTVTWFSHGIWQVLAIVDKTTGILIFCICTGVCQSCWICL